MICDSGSFRESWCKAIIMPVHKKSSINSPGNYRDISLLNIFCKIYTNILTRRLNFLISECLINLVSHKPGFAKDILLLIIC